MRLAGVEPVVTNQEGGKQTRRDEYDRWQNGEWELAVRDFKPLACLRQRNR